MYEILMVVYLVIALVLIAFILIQQGKGAGMGASFGAGASGTVFGASGSGNFLTKTTTILAIVFFGVALGLGNLTSNDRAVEDTGSLFPVDAGNGALMGRPVESDGDLPVESVPTATENAMDIPVEATVDEEKKQDKPKDPDGSH